MKFSVLGLACRVKLVTPLAGVWVEIRLLLHRQILPAVTPLAGVWVEIAQKCQSACDSMVTPLAGVWVEI